MKIKTSELTESALDWAVAKCEGEEVSLVKGQLETCWTDNGWKPSANWAQGGPIIERERISVWARGNEWAAESFIPNQQGHEQTGLTPLIAAMRCYVASKFGDEIELSEEIL